ncbi:hypothetical protein BJ138DRAFT_1019105, partial [Hygrophoropsis aurantiaca]
QRYEEEANVSLVRAGLIGCSPTNPTIAISIICLELYHQIRRRQSSFSIQAMAKVLCSLHNVTYTQTLRDQLSIAFDVYLAILRQVRSRVDSELGRTNNWHLRNACPACNYEQPDEPTLVPASLKAMDGNNSAKRMDGAGHTDQRVFHSSFLIPADEVDKFKDDVALRPGERSAVVSNRSTVSEDAASSAAGCADNWHAASVVEENKVKVFDQTGIFICACRHGIVLTLAEMRHSGELAKYPIATVNKLLDVLGDNQAIGSDIGCSFKTTLAASSVGEKARMRRLTLAVNAFHGYAHERKCQLRNHPLYLQGFGLEDLEVCERVFSASNSVAPLIRHASHFHYVQFLDLHFQQWNLDKYLELSRFLMNNYKQATSIISEYSKDLALFLANRTADDPEFEPEVWAAEELHYLSTASDEPERNILEIQYVEEAAYGGVTSVQFMSYTPSDFTPSSGLSTTARESSKRGVRERNAARRKLELQMNVINDLEHRLNIDDRWSEDHPSYVETLQYVKQREFIRTVDELEALVVHRLLELSKANLAGTGYKLRKQISRAISRRSAAIHHAVDRYNALAPLQDPPRPILRFSDVLTYASIGEFDLLKQSRHDILSKPWSKPQNREMATKYFKVARAREEIVRLNVEIRRLHAWADAEDQLLQTTADAVQARSPLIAAEMRSILNKQSRVNHIHRTRLTRIYKLDEYSGFRPTQINPDGTDVDEVDAARQDGLIPDDEATDESMRLHNFMIQALQ